MAGSGWVLGVAQDLEGERQKGVAGQDGGRLVEGEVQGRAAAADGVVVHRRQVVMHQRVAMDAFERASGGKRMVFRPTPNNRADSMRRKGRSRLPPPSAA